ncbi:MAG: hypothetical protein ACRDT0_01190 [Pseudonocardiaceae bacterium]
MRTDLETSIRDVAHTGRVVTVAQWGVASVVMVGSAISAGVAFDHFGEHFAVGVITGLAVDFALASWLLISRRLRAAGVTTAWGPVLEWTTAAMTLCLNSGASFLKGHYWLALGHAFLPVVLVFLTMAGGEAQHKLHQLMRHKQAAEGAKRDAEVERVRGEQLAEQRRVAAARESDNKARQAEADTARRQAELADERHEREMADRAAQRESRHREWVNTIAAVAAVNASIRAASHRRAVAHMASALLASASLRGSGRRSAGRRRQPVASGSPARVASGSPAAFASGSPARRQPGSPGGSPAVRQPGSPASRQAPPAATPDLATLVELAKPLLASEPGMGRPTLAKQLAAAAGGRVTDYRARQVLAAIDAEREAAFTAELETVLNGNGNDDGVAREA